MRWLKPSLYDKRHLLRRAAFGSLFLCHLFKTTYLVGGALDKQEVFGGCWLLFLLLHFFEDGGLFLEGSSPLPSF